MSIRKMYPFVWADQMEKQGYKLMYPWKEEYKWLYAGKMNLWPKPVPDTTVYNYRHNIMTGDYGFKFVSICRVNSSWS